MAFKDVMYRLVQGCRAFRTRVVLRAQYQPLLGPLCPKNTL